MRIINERPGCRKAIANLGLSPKIIDGTWDYSTVVQVDGRNANPSDGLLKQVRKMAREGHWGEIQIKPRRHYRVRY